MTDDLKFSLALTGEIIGGVVLITTLAIVAYKNPDAAAKTLTSFAYAGTAMVPKLVSTTQCR